jgi:hypothetical protein
VADALLAAAAEAVLVGTVEGRRRRASAVRPVTARPPNGASPPFDPSSQHICRRLTAAPAHVLRLAFALD